MAVGAGVIEGLTGAPLSLGKGMVPINGPQCCEGCGRVTARGECSGCATVT